MDIHANPIFLFIIIIILLIFSSNNPKLLQAGTVARGHIEFESNCRECHTPWRGALRQTCIDCHKKDKTRIDAMAHGEECTSCHLEHKGRTVIVGQYDHFFLNYELTEDHVHLVCMDCHSYGYLNDPVPACLDCHSKSTSPGEFNLTLNQVVVERACIHCHRKDEVDLEDFNIEDWI